MAKDTEKTKLRKALKEMCYKLPEHIKGASFVSYNENISVHNNVQHIEQVLTLSKDGYLIKVEMTIKNELPFD